MEESQCLFLEIAADYSNTVVRSVSFLLTPVWNRIYRGVLVHHLDKFKQEAPGHRVVYVPSHRSHGLLAAELFVVFPAWCRRIFLPASISICRWSAASCAAAVRSLHDAVSRVTRCILRCSANTWRSWWPVVIPSSISSRVGVRAPAACCNPKGGSLAMTVRAYLRQPTRPMLFQPVYIGYEKLMEGRSYLDELSGKPKRIDLAA